MGARGTRVQHFLVFIGRMSNGDAALAASGIVVTVMLAVLPAFVACRVGARRTAPGENGPRNRSRRGAIAGGFDVHPPRGSNVRALSEFLSQLVLQSQQPELWAQVRTIVPYLLMYIALFTSFDAMNMVFSFALKGAGDTRFVTLVALMVPSPIMVVPTYLMKDWNGAVY